VKQAMHDRILKPVAVLVSCVGIAALLGDYYQLPQPPVFNLHLLFGLTLATVVTVLLVGKARALAGTTGPELYLFTRLVSRCVYVLMYVLAAIRVGLFLVEHAQAAASPVTAHPVVRPLDDFQIYIAYCVIPLWLVRTLVLLIPFENRPQRSEAKESPTTGTVHACAGDPLRVAKTP
jgi:hypothetical protein